MCTENLRAPATAAVLSAVLAVAAAARAAELPPEVQGVAGTDQFPLTDIRPAGQSGGADSLTADEPPAVVPLPPALGTGLAGLGGMVVLRVGRRAYRRR